jgi:hypothetical protein
MPNFSPTGGSFNGIINYLNNFKHDLHLLIFTAQSSIYSGSAEAFQLVNYTNHGSTIADNTHTQNIPNSWFSFKFPFNINLTNYTLRTRTDDNSQHPRSWKLDGSFNNNPWQILHSVSNSLDLVGLNISKTYECTTQGVFNSFQLTLTGANSFGTNYFALKKIEFFWEILSPFGHGICTSEDSPQHRPAQFFPIFLLVETNHPRFMKYLR